MAHGVRQRRVILPVAEVRKHEADHRANQHICKARPGTSELPSALTTLSNVFQHAAFQLRAPSGACRPTLPVVLVVADAGQGDEGGEEQGEEEGAEPQSCATLPGGKAVQLPGQVEGTEGETSEGNWKRTICFRNGAGVSAHHALLPGDAEDLQEAWPLGKLLRPSATMLGSPVHTSSAFTRPSGKHRWKKSGRGLGQRSKAQRMLGRPHRAPSQLGADQPSHLPTTSFRVLVRTPLRTRARLAARREQRARVSAAQTPHKGLSPPGRGCGEADRSPAVLGRNPPRA